MAGKRLVLIRHAKAEQSAPDIRRSLDDRGRADARQIGRQLRELRLVPDLAVVSPATRTIQTWELAAAALDSQVRVNRDDRVWDNDVDTVLDIVAEQADDIDTLAIVGHNPSMHSAALHLAGSADRLAAFPTATLAVFSAPRWGRWDSAALVAVTTCRG